jgi:hypothetical protein
MNKNKFFELMMVSAAAAALAVGIVGVSAAAQSNVAAEGNSSDYTMSFSASKNKISAATAETTLSAATDAGNAVNFAYNNSATQMGYWGKFNADGYFKNTSAINGLKSMSLVLGNTNAIKVSYGWSPSTYPVSDIEISAAAAGDTVTYAFGDEKPPYFKLSYDTAQPLIKSMTLTYTCSATANPYWPEAEGLTMTLSSDGNSYYVSGCTKTATSVVINSTYKGKPVTSIGDRAFYGCTGLASVSIPSSVTSIGGYAFSGCTGLTKAEFASFESLCKISFADVSSNPLFYAHHLYIGGSEVTELVIPASVTSIGGYAFSGCSGLTSIDIPSSVTSIGGYAFDACTGLTSVSIPASVTSIGDSAFSGCFRLTSVSIPSSVTSIGDSTFSGCTGLTSVSIPSSVTSIGGFGVLRLHRPHRSASPPR